MKNLRIGFIKNLHYLFLIGVIALGLISIVGSNGGGDGTVDVNGYWQIWYTVLIEQGPYYWTFSQAGDEITITDSCDPDADPRYGTISGTSISFLWTEEDGSTISGTGTVSGDTASGTGTWTDADGNSGTLTWRAEKTSEPVCG